MHRIFIGHLCSLATNRNIVTKGTNTSITAHQDKVRRLLNFGSPCPLCMCVLYFNLMEFFDAVQHVLVSPDYNVKVREWDETITFGFLLISAVGRSMCFSLAELLIPERGLVCLCVHISVCVWLLYEVMARGSWQDVALMKGSFKGPISVYSPDDQSMESFAEIQPLFSLCLSMWVWSLVLFTACCAFNFNDR